MKTKRLTPQDCIYFIQSFLEISGESIAFELDPKKHAFIGFQDFQVRFELKLPLPFPKIIDGETTESYLKRVCYPFKPYSIILVQAGYSALGYFEKGEVLHHVATRTYMTRRKSGKNQLTFLDNGGRSGTSGGQLRYRNAIRFFEEINAKLNEWGKINNSERIFYSCRVKMWQFLFQSKVKCPFNKKDARLHKIPLDVNVPNFEEMIRINKKISFGYLTFFQQDFMSELDKHYFNFLTKKPT